MRSFSRANVAPTGEACGASASSRMGVHMSHAAESSVMSAKIGKRYCQLPSVPAANAAMKGPQNDETALTTWPAVSELVSASPLTTLVSSGLSDTWRIVLPMPSSTNAVMHVARL